MGQEKEEAVGQNGKKGRQLDKIEKQRGRWTKILSITVSGAAVDFVWQLKSFPFPNNKQNMLER